MPRRHDMSVSAVSGRPMRPRSRMSRWPSVVRKPILGTRRVITAFSPAVLARLNTDASATPSCSAPASTELSLAAMFGRHLGDLDPPSFDADDIGEGATDVDADHLRTAHS